ncbi:hypothetical protein N7491_009776 [Penicillium cf. griseofulvum]|uniref:Uncharacterized protein n=1 Tax=Penicillium cf. griseofulvum TaxID=2972120 RepID=A0A9W9MYL7_9EURO|nr:hypothetical protein N7472_000104 [Penicillium cf. griseofulvum]KAJ5421331.1 hypothetical protein N7491_009776 [Penicillium cf. griseofulvum]KAJ5424566.1 hypothetical protein N7445_010539 [Penicillium cf. griseofulvum]
MHAQSHPDKPPPSPRSAASPLNSSVPFIPISTLPPRSADSASPPASLSMSTPAMSTPPPALGLRGEYNPELRKRDEWPRLAPTLAALETMKEELTVSSSLTEAAENRFQLLVPLTPFQNVQVLTPLQALWAARDADFSFELTYQNRTLSTFDVLNQVHSIKLNALLLTPSGLNITTRHQTAIGIQKFTQANKNSLGVIVYLIDARSSGNEQIDALQSLGALHHCLSLGFSEPPPVLVVSDASYLLDCIGSYMKSVSRANPVR